MLRSKHNTIEFAITVIVGLCIYCLTIFIVSNNTTYKYAIELWNYGCEFLHVLYPLVFSIPFCWMLFHEKSGSFWKNIFNRTEINEYVRKRFLRAVFMSASAMFLVSMLSMIFAFIIARGTISEYEPVMTYKYYGEYQLSHPFTYTLLLSFGRSLLAALFTAFSIGLTMVNKNIFVVMTGAFIYSIAENFITAILQVPELSICTSFYPNRLSSTVVTLPKLLVGPLILLIFIVAIYVYYRKRERTALMD